MFANRDKATLIAELCGAQRENSIQNVLKLVEILINDARVDNDTVSPDNFRLNQGEIRGYNRLKEYILRGIPSVQKTA